MPGCANSAPVFSFDLNPPPLAEDPERFYRSGERSTVFALYQISMKLIGISNYFVHFLDDFVKSLNSSFSVIPAKEAVS